MLTCAFYSTVGEVMRQAINMVGAGETEVCFKLLAFLHQISKVRKDL